MVAEALDIAGLLDDWRARGADRLDPIRFQHIEALRRRAATCDGAVRRALEAKLAALVGAYTRNVERMPEGRGNAAPGRSALAPLIDAIAAHARADTGAAGPDRAYPELPAVEEFRALWSTLRTSSQVRKSLAEVPTGAGPLNSAALAYRSLSLMGATSPAYLERFLSYVDTLSWLETLQDAAVLTGREPPPTASGKPRAKAGSRKRKT